MRKNRLPGIVQWFRFGDYGQVKAAAKALKELGTKELRICFSWADWEREGGEMWYDWMIHYLDEAGLQLYPSLFYTPARCALLPEGCGRDQALTAFPPADPVDYAAFVQAVADRYENIFEWFLLWNEPNNSAYWRAELDPEWEIFSGMMRLSMDVLKGRDKKILVGSLIPPYGPWLQTMRESGVLEMADAVGIHDFPGTWNDNKRLWRGWEKAVYELRGIIYGHQEIWITETGFSTRTLDDPESTLAQATREEEQKKYFDEICWLTQPERIFWYSLFDQEPGHVTDNERNRPNRPSHDPRADGLGIIKHDGQAKPLFAHWAKKARQT